MSTQYKALNITKPPNCTIAFGIPTNEADFLQARAAENREFAGMFRLWERYKDEVVRAFEKVKPHYRRLGVHMVEGLCLPGFHKLFTRQEAYVIILFSHWKEQSGSASAGEGAVEFFDGFRASSAICTGIPTDYTGVLDLCVCHPVSLVDRIRKERPGCLTRYVKQKTTPLFWFYFYLDIFHRLHKQDITYIDAFRDAALEFADSG